MRYLLILVPFLLCGTADARHPLRPWLDATAVTAAACPGGVCPGNTVLTTVVSTPAAVLPPASVPQAQAAIPIRGNARKPLARLTSVPNSVTADLATLDLDSQATAAVQGVVTGDQEAIAALQAQLSGAQGVLASDQQSLAAAAEVQSAQLQQVIADLQAAYGGAQSPKLRALRAARDAALSH